MPKKIAVAVINHNGVEHLKDCFESILAQTYQDFDLYLIENGSSDNSLEYTKQNFPSVIIIKLDKCYGFAGGYNKGLSALGHEYIALLSNDTKADKNWLNNLITAIESNPKAAIVGSKLLFYEHPDKINSAGQKLTISGLSFDIGFGLKDQPAYNQRRRCGSVCGAGFIIRNKIFKELGGFDSDYYLLCEDTDLCWRIWLYGYQVLYEPAAFIYHKFGATIGKRLTPLRVYYTQRNSINTIIKNSGILRLLFALAIISGFTLFKLLFFAVRLQLDNLYSLIKGTLAIIPQLKNTIKKRRIIQRNRKIPDRFLKENDLMASLKESIAEYLRAKPSL